MGGSLAIEYNGRNAEPSTTRDSGACNRAEEKKEEGNRLGRAPAGFPDLEKLALVLSLRPLPRPSTDVPERFALVLSLRPLFQQNLAFAHTIHPGEHL